jgi:serine phosphatase RsbU (regulator of sigma subunit)
VRDFTDAETNIAEVVAGRLAADLERETLVEEAVSTRARARQAEPEAIEVEDEFDAEEPWSVEREETPPAACAAQPRAPSEPLPPARPMVEGWEVAARACHSGSYGGTFYDWFALDDGSLSIVAGDMCQHGVAGALTATLVRGAARAFGTQRSEAHEFAQRASEILWASSAGDATAGLLHAILVPGANVLEFCSAGPLRIMALGVDSFAALEGPSAALGLQETVRLASRHHPLGPEEVILAYGTTFLGAAADGPTLAAFDQRLALALEPYRGRPLERLIEVGDDILSSYLRGRRADRLLLLIRRRP